MRQTDRIERIFTRYLSDDAPLKEPDFDAMWERIEQSRSNTSEMTSVLPVPPSPRRRASRTVVLATAAVLLAATPAFAALSNKWDYITYRSGVRSALEQGLGQHIGKTISFGDAKLTLDTAVVDDNRTVLLFSLNLHHADPLSYPRFSDMKLSDSKGNVIEGDPFFRWNPEEKRWQGEFSTDWTPDSLRADVKLSAENLLIFSAAQRDISIDAEYNRKQTIEIGQDGIDRLVVLPFTQGDKTLLSTSVFFSDKEAQSWSYPSIGVYDGAAQVKEPVTGAFGKPGDQGEYTGLQYFNTADLKTAAVKYKLNYTRKSAGIDGSWSLNLQLDKERMLDGTSTRPIDQIVETAAGPIVLKEMTITPTQIRITGTHEKYKSLSFKQFNLNVNGTQLKGGFPDQKQGDNYGFTLRFERQPGLVLSEQTPIALYMKYEVTERLDKNPIHLAGISSEKKTITTQLGGYAVNWTYYKENGNLYIESGSDDPRFGGVNQTYMKDGKRSRPGRPVTANFNGDGNNRMIDMYKDFAGTEADIYIYFYSTDDPHKELRIDLPKFPDD
ncbi:DUF4179 domain-containing protein [Cohnella sp. JJ-181]|uniref:DUF4179 domain-containing protein n=1 Tax=Cohnella rhizoplanae TaxID=2974897 RepID=UPI0022FFAAC1|nr:DUF4179 domain-containing protein [Cohnella sp. JJ-181]CAI6085512.1 hypothetical protein COHCIP112018_04696 [Cohnella sp. JJ-181]